MKEGIEVVHSIQTGLSSAETNQTIVSGKRVFHSNELFGNDREIVILHGEAQYRLLITKAGKLILNK